MIADTRTVTVCRAHAETATTDEPCRCGWMIAKRVAVVIVIHDPYVNNFALPAPVPREPPPPPPPWRPWPSTCKWAPRRCLVRSAPPRAARRRDRRARERSAAT